jgi:hypothetical protein
VTKLVALTLEARTQIVFVNKIQRRIVDPKRDEESKVTRRSAEPRDVILRSSASGGLHV